MRADAASETAAVSANARPSRVRRLRATAGVHLVPDAADRLHDGTGVAQLLPQRLHVRVDRARVDRPLVAPDAVEQLLARENDPTVAREEREKVELFRRQRDVFATGDDA